MKVWPFGVALRGVMSNRLKLRWLKTVVVSVGEKAQENASGGDREGERKRTADDVPKQAADIRTGSVKWVRDEPGGTLEERDRGTPQGSAVSPVLANLFMHYAFDTWLEREFPAVRFERYADDAVVHCATERQARQVLAALAARMEEVGLRLHPGKTRIVYCKDSRRRGSAEHTSFTFLGYTFGPRRATYPDGKAFTSFLPAVSAEALKAMGLRVRSWRIHMRTGDDLGELAGWINPIVGLDGVLRPVLPVGTVSLPAARQHLPDALGAEEIQEAALLQALQLLVDRTSRSRSRTVQVLGVGETVLLEKMRRAV
jgi:hypothetical protein